MKKVLFVISTLNTGGAQKVLSNLLVNLPNDYEPVVVLNDNENIVYPYKGKIVSLGFKSQKNKLNILYMFKVLVKRVIVLRKMKNTGEYCACISFLDSANIANILSGGKKCKTILSVHSTISKTAKSKKHRFILFPLIKMLYGKAYKIVAVSKGIQHDLIEYFKLKADNIVTIPNGHELEKIRAMGKNGIKKYSDSETVFCNVGRLCYPKGQWHLIRAFAQVKKEIPQSRLVILGEGEYREYLENLAKGLDVADYVDFKGFVLNPYEIMSMCDIYVQPSLYEGFPNSLIEALALELPCIASDFRSGAREVLAPKLPVEEEEKQKILECTYGIITPVCDGTKYTAKDLLTVEEKLLAEAMIKMALDKKMLNHYINKDREAVKDLDIQGMVKKWNDII